MASAFVEKIQVAAVTATLVSAGWIVAGGFLLDQQEAQLEAELLAVAASPTPSPAQPDEETATLSEQAAISTPREEEIATLMIPVLNVRANELVDNYADEATGGQRLHEAIDIMAPRGTTVVAAGPGTIERLFRSDAGGNTIYVRSNDRETIHYYAHLEKYAQGLNEGQIVRRGQRLGEVGSSGNADFAQPHLHFAVLRTTPDAQWWEPSTALNPYPLLTKR